MKIVVSNIIRSPLKKGFIIHSSSARRPAGEYAITDDLGGAYVYRAIRQERAVLGWSQAPCGHCPQFEFCKTGGPVNPQQCAYYGDWLDHTEMKMEE